MSKVLEALEKAVRTYEFMVSACEQQADLATARIYKEQLNKAIKDRDELKEIIDNEDKTVEIDMNKYIGWKDVA